MTEPVENLSGQITRAAGREMTIGEREAYDAGARAMRESMRAALLVKSKGALDRGDPLWAVVAKGCHDAVRLLAALPLPEPGQ